MAAEDGQINALLVRGKERVKETRTALAGAGYYDSSRRISHREGGRRFAFPITTSAAAQLMAKREADTNLDPAFTDSPVVLFNGVHYTLTHAQLPPSKSAVARTKTSSAVLKSSLETLLSELEPPVGSEMIEKLMEDIPTSWERHGDLVVLPPRAFVSGEWKEVKRRAVDFWGTVAKALECNRLAQDSQISRDGFRSSSAVLLRGSDPWVEHSDNGVRYVFDVTRIMFSSGNVTEKLRVAEFDCRGEVVVDMYAGIGYFTLPFLVHGRARTVHACEWNPVAVEGLGRGLVLNGVREKCAIHQGDCRKVCPAGVADRVNLGLIPCSEGGWAAACAALRRDRGGWLHVHGNVSWKHGNQIAGTERNPWEVGGKREVGRGGGERREEGAVSSELRRKKAKTNWAEYVVARVGHLLKEGNPLGEGWRWDVRVGRVVTVKSYAPFVDHLVVDVECRPTTASTE